MAEERLYRRCGAIHGEADGTRRSQHAHLRIAIAVAPAQFLGIGPTLYQFVRKIVLTHIKKEVEIDARGLYAEPLEGVVARARDAGMVSNDACHMALIDLIAYKGLRSTGHYRGGRVALPGHNANKGGGEGPGARRIIGQTLGHEQARQI